MLYHVFSGFRKVSKTQPMRFNLFIYRLETDRYQFYETVSPIFFFADIWPVSDILLTTDTDIQKFAYRYICRHFNKVFWLKLVGIAFTSLVHFSSNINQYKRVYVTAKIAKQCCIGKI